MKIATHLKLVLHNRQKCSHQTYKKVSLHTIKHERATKIGVTPQIKSYIC